jgi:hypothetical protein
MAKEQVIVAVGMCWNKLSNNKLQPGMDQIDVKDAWRTMGNGVNSYTRNVVLKGSTFHVEPDIFGAERRIESW